MRTKGLKRKISNVLLLGVLLAIVVGIYYNVYNSKAENTIELSAIALDNYAYLEDEEFNIEAKSSGNNMYEIEIPESINGKKVLEVAQVTLRDKADELTEENSTTTNTENTSNTTNAANTINATNTTNTTNTTADLENTVTGNTTTENAETEDTVTEQQEEQVEENVEVLEIKDNKIQLTKEQLETKQISIEVKYDVAILETTEEGEYQKNLLSEKTEEEIANLEITEETQMLYSKILKYEDEENGKIVELKGYLPKDAQIQVEEVSQEQLVEVFGDKKIDIAYDIKIIVEVEKEVLVDENDPEGETKIITEKVEINPEEFGETCEVSIKDANIEEDSKVYHVKDDNTYEEVTVKESEDESISFEATKFSIYAVSADDGVMAAITAYDKYTDIDRDEYDQAYGGNILPENMVPDTAANEKLGLVEWLGPFHHGTQIRLLAYSTSSDTYQYAWGTTSTYDEDYIIQSWRTLTADSWYEDCTQGYMGYYGYPGYIVPLPSVIFSITGQKYLYIKNERTGYINEFGPYNLDYIDPTAGKITAETQSGDTYSNGTWVNQGVNVTVTAGYETQSDVYGNTIGILPYQQSGYYQGTVTITNPDGTQSTAQLATKASWNVIVTDVGTTKIELTDVDNAGNYTTTTFYVKIDYNPPTFVSVSPESSFTYTQTKKVGVTLNDDLSGLSSSTSVKFSWKTTATTGGSAGEAESVDGSTYYYTSSKGMRTGIFYLGYTVSAVDRAGNPYSKEGCVGPFYIDNTAPDTPTYTAFYDDDSSSYTSGTWTNRQVNTTITSADSHAGVTKIQYSKDKSTWTDLTLSESNGIVKSGTTYYGTEPWNLKNRNDTYYFRAVDGAGNASAATSAFNIKYDISPPTGTISASATMTQQSSVTIYVSNVSDEGDSGIKTVIISGYAFTQSGTNWLEKTATWDSTNSRYYATFSFDEVPNRSTGETDQGNGIYYFDAHIYDNANNNTSIGPVSVTYDNRTPNIKFEIGDVTSGLIRHYEAMNNTGAGSSSSTTVWKDLSGHYDGTISGATWGSNSNYLAFDGTDDYVACGTTNGLTTVTLEAVVSIDTLSHFNIISNFEFGGFGMEVLNGVPIFQVHLNGEYVSLEAGTTLSTGTKYRITGTYDGSNLKIYIDGVLQATVAGTGSIDDPTLNTVMMIGSNPFMDSAQDPGYYLDGNIYSVRIYNRALTQAEINQNIAAESADTTWRKSKDITVNLVDDVSGLAAGASIQYGWSTSLTTAPSKWTTASITSYTAGAKTTSFTASAVGLSGKYYLWVKPVTLADVAGNSVDTSLRAKLTKLYYFDNTAPTISIFRAGIPADEITAEDYGGTVTNYASSNGESITWRILHSDGDNIYLIAKEYVKKAAFSNATLNNNYTGSEDIADSEIAKKWLSEYIDSGYTSTNLNMKATAYLLDQEIWGEYGDGEYAEWAIGGPTLELLRDSVNIFNTSKELETQVDDAVGYKFKLATDSSYKTYVSELVSDSLYVTSGGTWIASPSASSTSTVVLLLTTGNLGSMSYSMSFGFRPVVCLKSETQLAKLDDGTYMIINTASSDQTTWAKSKYAEVQISDLHSGLAEGAQLQYGWSTSNTTEPTSWTTVTVTGYSEGARGATFTAKTENELTGKYYLWVKPVDLKDISVEGGNSQTNSTVSSGTYWLDNTAPTITLGTQENSTWSKEHSVTVTITDNHSGLALGSAVKYGWSTSTTTEPEDWKIKSFGNAEAANSATITVTNSDSTGKYYLWVEPHAYGRTLKDLSYEGGNLQENTTISTGTFWFDNTAPTVTVTANTATNSSAITADDYGGYVTNYTPSNSADVGWRIFHSDGTNIYLIADDYVHADYVPDGKGGSEIYENDTSYDLSFDNIVEEGDYSGGSSDIATDNPARKWLSQYTLTSTKRNMQATAYLMDTDAWSVFEDGTYAEYAIGGPTIELFAASYNTVHSTTIETRVSESNSWGDGSGYELKPSTFAYYYYFIGPGLRYSKDLTDLYLIGTNEVWNMWLASPSIRDTDYLIIVNKEGVLNTCEDTAANVGIRPVVCLKAEYDLEKQDDGTYLIVKKEDAEWRKSHNATITISDAYSGLAEGAQIKYGWSTSSVTEPNSYTTATITGYTEGANTATFTITNDNLTGKYYLWVKPVDVRDTSVEDGNVVPTAKITTTGAFYFDNTAPSVEILEGIVTDGLIRHYDAVNNTGNGYNASATTWKDLSGNYDATITGATFTGESLSFNSTDHKVDAGTLGELSEFTLEMNFKTDATMTSQFFRAYTASNFTWLATYTNSSSVEITACMKDQSNNNSTNGTNITMTTSEEFKTLTITFKDGVFKFFVDGEYVQGSTLWINSTLGWDSTTSITLGGGGFDLTMFRMYNRALTDEEVLTNAGATLVALDSWSKSKYVTVKIADAHSGLATGAKLQYGWSTSLSTEPTTWTTVEVTGYTEGANSAQFTATASPETIGEEEPAGKYYLWVQPVELKDISVEGGNSQTNGAESGLYWIDNKVPTITLGTQENNTWSKEHSVTVTISDAHSGLAEGAQLQYQWVEATESGSSGTPSSSGWTTTTLEGYTATSNSATFQITNNELTGKYYLWVQPASIKDTSLVGGNEITGTEETTLTTTGSFWFDNTKPENIVITPDKNETWSKSHSATITISDLHSGLATGAAIQYGWSTSATEEPESYVEATISSYNEGDNTATFEAAGSGLNGKYYLWVKPVDIRDTSVEGGNALGTTAVVTSGTFWFDNTAPTISIDPQQREVWAKTHSAEVTITDTLSGVASGAKIRYQWVKENEDGTLESVTEDGWTTAEVTGYTAGSNTATYTITTSYLRGKHYLYIQAVDVKDTSVEGGNAMSTTDTLQSEGTFWFDYIAPTISITPEENTTWRKTHSATITIADAHCGLATGAELKYGWSTSADTEPDEYTTVNPEGYEEGINSTSFVISGSELTGKYYLWVVPVTLEDLVGNVLEEPQVSEGTFYFDNTAPTVNATVNELETWRKEHTATITLEDIHSGLAEGAQIQYQWVKVADDSETPGTPTTSGWSTTTTVSGYTAGTNSAALTVTDTLETGKYHLFVKVVTLKDTSVSGGNATSTTTTARTEDTFWFDNTKPTISLSPNAASSVTYVKGGTEITVTASDANAGLIANAQIQYQWVLKGESTVDSNWTQLTATNTAGASSTTYTVPASESSTLNGIYNLYIKEEITQDNVADTTKNANESKVSGDFYFDNTEPAISIDPDSRGWARAGTTVKVIIDDKYGTSEDVAGLPANISIQYQWVISGSSLSSSGWKTATGTNAAGANYTEVTVPTEGTNGEYYLYIKEGIADSAGNATTSQTQSQAFKFDNTKPEVTFEPNEQVVYSKEGAAVEVTLSDSLAGLVSDVSIQYQWVKGDLEPSSSGWSEPITGTNEAGAASTIRTVPQSASEGLTGIYYLYIKAGTVGDNVMDTIKNTNDQAKSGAFYFDNTETQISFSTPPTGWVTGAEVTVTATDADAGLKANASIQYQWATSSSELSSTGWTTLTASNAAKAPTVTWTVPKSASEDIYSGLYYLYIKEGVEDAVGNLTDAIAVSEQFKFDNTKPEITEFSPNTQTNYTISGAEVTVTIEDAHAGLAENVSIQYQWATSSSTLSTSGWQTATGTNEAGAASTTRVVPASASNGLTGEYYLFIKAESVRDNVTDTTTENVNDQKQSGVFYFDNARPTISFEPNAATPNTAYYRQTPQVVVTISDLNAGLAENVSIQYQWATSSSELSDSDWTTVTGTNTAGAASTTRTVPVLDKGFNGDYYLFIKAGCVIDNVTDSTTENSNVLSSTAVFHFDNTKPTITVSPDEQTDSWSRGTAVTVTGTDTQAGFVENAKIQYQWVESSSTPTTDGWTELTATNAEKAQTVIWTIPKDASSTLSGNYKLYIKSGVTGDNVLDETKNTNDQVVSGIFQFDSEKPTIVFTTSPNIDYHKGGSSAIIRAYDEYAGLIENAELQYQWVLEGEEPDDTKWSDPITANGNTGNTAGEHTVEFHVPITASEDLTGDYRLYIKSGIIKDNITDDEKNTNDELKSGKYYFDNTKPRVEFSPNNRETWAKDGVEVELTISDVIAGLGENIVVEYQWAKSEEELTSNWLQTTNNVNAAGAASSTRTVPASASAGMTGEYYLFIKQGCIKDNVVTVDKNENDLTKSGAFYFDNIGPVITLSPESQEDYTRSTEVTVTATDAESGLSASAQIQYQWVAVGSTPESGSWKTLSSSNAAGDHTTTWTVPAEASSTLTGQYKLYIKEGTLKDNVVDTNKNTNVETISGEFNFDNTKPVISNVTGNPTQWTNSDVTLTISATDENVGLHETPYSFDNGETWQASNQKTYAENTSGIIIKVRDALENVQTYSSIDITKIDKTSPVITFEPNIQDEWTKSTEVTVKATDAQSGLSANARIQYQWVQVGSTPSDSNWTLLVASNSAVVGNDGEKEVTWTVPSEASSTLTGEYKLYIKAGVTLDNVIDTNKNANIETISDIFHFDNLRPVPGTLIMKLEDSTGTTYTSNTWTRHSVYIKPIDGSDAHSGHGTTSYTIKKDGEDYLANQTGEITLTETGTYTITVNTTDNVGNADARDYTVQIDKIAPVAGILTMKQETSTGEDYTNDTWINKSVYIAKVDGSDTLSGHYQTTYSVTKDGEDFLTNMTAASTLETDGEYVITVTTEDKSGRVYSEEGNKSTNTYIVKIDKTNPILIISGEATGVTDGLIRHYDVNNNLGNGHSNTTTTWNDLSGNYDAQVNGATFTDAYITLDGTDDWVNLGEITDKDYITLEASIKINAIQSGEIVVIGNYQDGGMGIQLIDGKPAAIINVNGTYVKAQLDEVLDTDRIYNISATYDGTSVKLYVNGVLHVETAASGTIQDATGNTVMAIGANPNGDTATEQFANIKLYSARIYDRALTQDEIKKNLNADRISPEKLVANDSSVTLSFVFSENVTGFDASDITITNGTKGTFTKVSDSEYTLNVTGITAQEDLVVQVAEESYIDRAGNNGNSPETTRTRDTISPTVTITSDVENDITKLDSVTYTFTFSEPIVGFTADDIEVTNGTKGTFTKVSNTEFTLVVTNTKTCLQTVTLKAGAVSDDSGNLNVEADKSVTIDKTIPVITATPDKTTNEAAEDGRAVTSQVVTITVEDTSEDEVEDSLQSGLDPANEYQYYLSQDATRLVPAQAGATWTDYTSGTPFTIGTGLTGTYYLFVKQVYDNVGNVSETNGKLVEYEGVTYHLFKEYVFDNSSPIITVVPDQTTSELSEDGKAVTSQEIIIRVAEPGTAGLSSSNSYQYYLSSSREELKDAEWTNYTASTPFTIGTGLTGTYYLFIKTVSDNVGNVSSTNGTMTEIDDTTTYHLFEEFVFDNSEPEIEFDPVTNPNYQKSQSTKVTITEIGTAGINAETVKYLWVQGTGVPTEEEFTGRGTLLTSGDTITKADGTGNNFYLWVMASDNLENKKIIQSEKFYLDNTKPTIGVITPEPSSETTYTLTISNILDTSTTVYQSGVKGYYISTNSTPPTEETEWADAVSTTLTDKWIPSSASTATFENAPENTLYYIWAIDNAGNISEVTEFDTKIIHYSLNDEEWFETFEEAVAAASDGDTIKVVKSVEDTSDGTVDKNIILDTNGYTLTKYSSRITVKEGCSLEIKGSGTITSDLNEMIVVEGTLTVTAGKLDISGQTAIINKGSGDIQINGGKVEGNIYTGAGTLYLNGGEVTGTIYGGQPYAEIETVNIILNGTNIKGDIYGGNGTKNVGTANITLTSGSVTRSVYGGNNVGTANITLDGATVKGSIYGGGSVTGTVTTANINIKSGKVANVYGGASQGGTVTNANITIQGTANITKNVYGGGDKATIGTASSNGNVIINIAGGTIGGNVYGGANEATVYGNITMNIGKDAVSDSTLESGSIVIKGNVYGGGSKEGITTYTDKTVTGTSNVTIDGNGHTIFTINQHIFGSGEYCTVNDSNVTIKNIGTSTTPYTIQSIQRVGTLTIDNCNLEIIGIADDNNADKDTAFTLNRIGNLKIKNGTTLHLRRGFNLVEELNSLVDVSGTETKATVNIQGGAVSSSNVTNRLYVYEGVNLIIAKAEYKQNQVLSEYGKVNGMTFFGMYTHDHNDNEAIKYDIYDPTSPSNGNLFKLGSYVEGLYDSTGATSVDGFYTNAVDETDSSIIAQYVDVITYAPTYQDWMLGVKTYTQEVTMIAKRNKDKVYKTVPLDYLTEAGVEYNISLFSVNSLEKGVSLIEKTKVPTIASTEDAANTTFSLLMTNGSEGWKTQGETYFYSAGSGTIAGTTQYITDDSGNVPYIDLYLYNSININDNTDCGLVSIIFLVKQTSEDGTSGGVFKIAITVNIQTMVEENVTIFETESQIAAGTNYELFVGNEIHITDRSSMTFYTNTYPVGTYGSADYRVLVTNCEIPVNTEITMLDYAQGTIPLVYYYVVTGYDAIEDGKYIYNLSNFKLMGAASGTINYSNPNSTYSDKDFEEYRFIFDFKDTTIEENLTGKVIYLEIRDGSTNEAKNHQTEIVSFNIYNDSNSELTLQVDGDTSNVYDITESGNLKFKVTSNLTKQFAGTNTIEDTYYYEKKLGISIALYDSENNRVPYEQMKGTYFKIGRYEYYPDITGLTRIYLADNIVTVTKNLEMTIETDLIDSGEYKIRIENFASADGQFYGLEPETEDNRSETTIKVVDLTHGLQVEIADTDRVIDAPTGKTYNGEDNIMNFNIKASDIVENTNIRMTLYRRDVTYNSDLTTYAAVTYTEVDLQDYVTEELTTADSKGFETSSTYEYDEYLVTDEVTENTLIELALNLEENLPTGGYKLVFKFYSGNTKLGSVERHFVATDLITVNAET